MFSNTSLNASGCKNEHVRPAKLPPITTEQTRALNLSRSSQKEPLSGIKAECSPKSNCNLPVLSASLDDDEGLVSGCKVSSSCTAKDSKSTPVPFRSEQGDLSSSVTSASHPLVENFHNIIPPPTPPKITVKSENSSLLKRPQKSPNTISKLKALNSQELGDGVENSKTSRHLNCHSAGELRKKGCASEPQINGNRPSVLFSLKQFRSEVEKWKKTKKVSKLQEFYRTTFDSFKSVNDAFKKTRPSTLSIGSHSGKSSPSLPNHLHDPSLQQKFVGMVYETLLEMPREVQKTVLKGVINCLLNEWKGEKTESDLRAYFILLQNPMFARIETYIVYAHLLRQIATLNDHDQLMITHWLRRLSTPRFRPMVERLHQFVTLRLFPGQSDELPPMTSCGWWIPSAMKVFFLLNKANNLVKPRLVSFREFYNHSLDHIDVMAEFRQWENPASHSGFTFCQYPFILSLVAKLRILKQDQERQMIRTARDELVASIRRRPARAPCVSQLFLNIKVRREHLLSDSLEQIYGNRKQLKKKLRVEFVGEPGYDMGGLTKEWFLLLLRKVLSPDYNTFVYNEKSRSYWFADNASENSSDLFLVGVLMGLAVYNCITLDIRLPMICYRKLLSSTPRSTSPQAQTAASSSDHDDATSAPTIPLQDPGNTTKQTTTSGSTSSSHPIGAVSVTLEDYRSIDPDMTHGLEELLKYEGNVEEDFGLTFQLSQDDLGAVRTVPLKSGGDRIVVTKKNRTEYVQALLNYKLNKSIYRQFLAFYHGFYTVCSSNALSFLCPEELETLVCGNTGFDLRDLKKHTAYQGYVNNDPTILHFWDVLFSLSRDLQKRFLHFCTGSDRVPVGGLQELNFKIVRTPTTQNMLPMAHTCFNQLLLPPYGSKQQLEGKLVIAISNAEGFWLE
ncbi:putative E3 ubiquitin-protein ligase HECTD2 [Clavelina lepadiformis]|uniref:putative E3 ubiquitin-protein ligase HECTD2 n=1 Tax=Clavelina lepadiformis TaxID=159417 RepID=UPI0040428433